MPSSLRQVTETLFRERFDEDLAAWVRTQRDEGDSWRDVSLALYVKSDGDINLGPQTLHTWLEGYAPPTPADAA